MGSWARRAEDLRFIDENAAAQRVTVSPSEDEGEDVDRTFSGSDPSSARASEAAMGANMTRCRAGHGRYGCCRLPPPDTLLPSWEAAWPSHCPEESPSQSAPGLSVGLHILPTAKAMPCGPCVSLSGRFCSLVCLPASWPSRHPSLPWATREPDACCRPPRPLGLAFRMIIAQLWQCFCASPSPLHPVLQPCLNGFFLPECSILLLTFHLHPMKSQPPT